MNSKITKKSISKSIVFFSLVLVALLALVPIAIFITISFLSYQSLVEWGIEGNEWVLDNYSMLMESYWSSLIFSIVVFIVDLILTLLLILPTAFFFSKNKIEFKGKKTMFIGLVTLLMIPNIALLSSQYKIIVNLNLDVTTFGLVLSLALPGLFKASCFFIMKASFDKQDENFDKLIKVEQISNIKYFWICITNSKKELLQCLFLIFIGCWNALTWPRMVLMGQEYQTMTMWILSVSYEVNSGSMEHHPEIQSAASILASLPLIIIFALNWNRILNSIVDVLKKT